MTYQEAHDILHPNTTREAVQKIQNEKSTKEAMEAINEACVVACETLEKQMAKKPIIYSDTNRADCPNCGATVRGLGKPFGDWCSRCGQAIDWSDEET